jgi:hypothetical protein
MSITKLYAGVVGDPLNTSGPQLAASVNQLIDTHVSHLKALPTAANAQTNTVYKVISFYDGWAALTSTPSGGGLFVWNPTANKALHNGITHYSPESILAWDGTQADLPTLLDWTGSGTGVFVRIRGESLNVEMAGAVQSNAINNAAAITKTLNVAASLQCMVSGTKGIWYGVSGNITTPTWVWLESIKLKQLTPASVSRRTLFQASGTKFHLKDVTVDRNGDGSSGSLTDAAGVWVNDCPDVNLEDVEVFGNDFGSGIAVIRCDNAVIKSIFVHDIAGGTNVSAAITDDSIHGLWVQGGTGVTIINPRIRNLLNRWSGQASFNRFSRGIAIGGSKRFSISNPMVDNVDQGIDLTGDQNPEFFEVTGGIISNCYTWGTKCANSVQNGVFTGVVAYRCGQSGFVSSSPSVVMPDRTQNITYTGCKSIQTGFGGVWTSLANVAGFRVANTGTYPDYPRSIKYVGCSADGADGAMEYGFFSDATLGTTDGEQWIEAIHCDVQGAIVKNYYGLNNGYADRQRSTAQSIPNNVWTDLEYTSTTDFMGASSGVASTELSATRSGIYTIDAGITWAGSNVGTRFIRLMLNGVVVRGSIVRIPAVTANEFNMNTSITIPVNTGGLPVKVQVCQDSGAALNILGGAFRLSLVSAGYGGN